MNVFAKLGLHNEEKAASKFPTRNEVKTI